MAQSLDQLIDFLLEEIALGGDQGVTITDVARYANRFYAPPQPPLTSTSTTSNHKVDKQFIAKIWQWLTRHEDVIVLGNEDYGALSLAELENRFPNILAEIPDSSSQPQLQQGDDPFPPATISAEEASDSKDEPRISVTLTRIYHAICGHGPDPSKVPTTEFALLCVIARSGHDGILQGPLTRITGQDKRSVPQRTDRLHQKGYIVKKAAYLKNGQKTSRLTLRRFVNEALAATTPYPDDSLTLKELTLQTFDVLKQNSSVTLDELAAALNVKEPGQRRILGQVVDQLVTKQCLELTQATADSNHDVGKPQKCLQVLRELADTDWQTHDGDDLDFEKTVKQAIATVTIKPSLVVNNASAYDVEEPSSSANCTNEAALRPRWNPDRQLPNILHDLADNAGHKGITNIEARQHITGLAVRRMLESALTRLSHASLQSQPPALRNLALVRSHETEDTISRYVHRTFASYNGMVQAGQADWAAVTGGKETMKEPTTMLANDPKSGFDEETFGFLRRTKPRMQIQNGQVELEEIVKLSGARSLELRAGEVKIGETSTGSVVLSTVSEIRQPTAPRAAKAPKPAQMPKRTYVAKPKPFRQIRQGRPRKFVRGTEEFWRDMMKLKKEQDKSAFSTPTNLVGTTQDPDVLMWFNQRPADFDDTLLQAVEHDLPVPSTPQDVNQSWIDKMKRYLRRNSSGLHLTPAGATKVLRGHKSFIATIRSSRLSDVDFSEFRKPATVLFLSSSAAHTIRCYGLDPWVNSGIWTLMWRANTLKRDYSEIELANEGQGSTRASARPLPQSTKSQGRTSRNSSISQRDVSSEQVLSKDASSGKSARPQRKRKRKESTPVAEVDKEQVDPGPGEPRRKVPKIVNATNGVTSASNANLDIEQTHTTNVNTIPSPQSTFGAMLSDIVPHGLDNALVHSLTAETVKDTTIPTASKSTGRGISPRRTCRNDSNQELDIRSSIRQHAVENVSEPRPSPGPNVADVETESAKAVSETVTSSLTDVSFAQPPNLEKSNTQLQIEPQEGLSDFPAISLQDLPEEPQVASSVFAAGPASSIRENTPSSQLAARRSSTPRLNGDNTVLLTTPRDESAKKKKTYPKPAAGPGVLTGLKAAPIYQKIILEMIQLCGGVAPDSVSVLKRAMKATCIEARVDHNMGVKALRTAINKLTKDRKIKHMKFAFQSNGQNHFKTILALPDIQVEDSQFRKMSQQISKLPVDEDYMPSELEAEYNRQPSDNGRQDLIQEEGKEVFMPADQALRSRHVRDGDRAASIVSSSGRRSLSPLPTITSNTGFLTLKVPEIGTIRSSTDFTSHYFSLPAQPEPIRFTADANAAATETAAPLPTSLRRSGVRIPRNSSYQPGQRKIQWRIPKRTVLPKSLKAILSQACQDDEVHFEDDSGDQLPDDGEPSTQSSFLHSICHVGAFELRNWDDLQERKPGQWNFINFMLPKKEAIYIPCQEELQFYLVHFTLNAAGEVLETEEPLPEPASWDVFSTIVTQARAKQKKIDQIAEKHKRKRKFQEVEFDNDESDFADSEAEDVPSKKARRRTRPAKEPKQRVAHTENDKRKMKRGHIIPRGTGMRNVSKEMAHRISLAFVVARVLAGGLDKHIDFSLVNRMVPSETEAILQERWKVLGTRYNNDIDTCIAKFQTKYLDALADDKVPMIDYSDFENSDWNGILNWAVENISTDMDDVLPDLPPTREELLAIKNIEIPESRPVRNLFNQSLSYTITSKEEAWASAVMGIVPNALPDVAGEVLEPKFCIEDDYTDIALFRARSWVLAAVLTSQEDFNSVKTAAKLNKLAVNKRELETLLSTVTKKMQADKIIVRERSGDAVTTLNGTTYSGTHGWKICTKWFDKFESNRHISATMLKDAARYKLEVLDVAFAGGQRVILEKSPHIKDGAMIAVLNLLHAGMLQIKPGYDVPASRYGLDYEEQGYKTRSMDRDVMSFTTLLEASPSYVFGDFIAKDRAIPGSGLAEEDEMCLIPAWFDINHKFLPQIWESILGAVVGIISVRPGVSSIEIVRTLNWALSVHDLELIVQYMLGCNIIEKTCTGWTTTAWWWLAVGCGLGHSHGVQWKF
ncbi:hypothetical protein LTR64_003463 [Lithohypha guttulata]|uniref:uncharacterized protein n=1 Tax=Lithohypha guttulata TaxID=1690604 RepID=UPI002DE12BA4|nr:hypothetical protein LTR51_000318 [Lithohypha guttulata]